MTAPLSEVYLAEIEARCTAAYPGPWHVDNDSADLNRWVTDATGFLEINLGYRGNSNAAEAEFIAHAREDVPALLADNARLRAIQAQAVEAIESSPEAFLAPASQNMTAALILLREGGTK